MGAEQSAHLSDLAQKARESGKIPGISPKPGRTVTLENIIVVNPGEPQLPQVDAEVKQLQEIPEFYPILRASLNLAGLKDPPDVNSKFDFRPVLALAQRYQRHLGLTAEVVTSEQTSLGQRIREIDFAVSTLNNFLTERQKKYAKYTVELGKVREISASLRKITGLLPELVDSAWKLNDFLPADLQLDRLSLEKFTQPPAPATASATVGAGTASVLSVIDGVEEQKVVDLSGSVEISAGPKLP